MLILRRFYSRHLVNRVKGDPGVNRQRKLLQVDTQSSEDCDFEDLDSDFMTVDKSHKEYLREQQLVKEKQQYLIVKQKYFKEKWPNFLTWQDKQMIQYLHNQDMEEWTVERLSEGFPALPQVIQKILRSKWTTSSHNKILNHDKSVLRNWDDFKEGKLDNLPEELREHLMKFSKRGHNVQSSFECLKPSITAPKKGGEFYEIIASYQKIKNESNDVETFTQNTNSEENVNRYEMVNNKLSNKFGKKSRPMTLRALEKDVARKAEQQQISLEERLIIEKSNFDIPHNQESSGIIELDPEQNHFVEPKDEVPNKNEVSLVAKKKDLSHLIYPEKIKIPKDIREKGLTYKLKDCFYDSDGWFLYRVPGMCE